VGMGYGYGQCKMEEIGVEERDCQLFFVPNCVSYIKCDRYSVQ